jgi:pyrroline-5-carboxylate reductase
MSLPVIAIIGAGNMGTSLMGGLVKNGHPAQYLWASDPSEAKLDYLKTHFKVNTTTDNAQAVALANVVIFAIKPHSFAAVAKALHATIQAKKPLIISIAAGIRINAIEKWLGGHLAVVRAMPNTPALIGSGAAGLHANAFVTSTQHNLAESILRAVGITVWLEKENMLDTVTALSGSGPAYFFHMMEALQLAAEECGLSKETARLLTAQTAFGAARMALESSSTLDELRRHVTSPGGTTEKAISVLEEGHVRQIYQKAIQAAKHRSEELADQLGETK